MNLPQMHEFAKQTLYNMGAQTVLVTLEPTYQTIAATVGIKIENIPAILGLNSPGAAGIIYVNEKILKKFTNSEIQFIIAHECAHIFHNHAIASMFWNLLEDAVKGDNNEHFDSVEIIKLLLALSSQSKLPPNAETLRNQEYEADRVAVNITGDLMSALSCLTKLAGNNMNSPSHTWELFNNTVPAMTMGERISTLRAGVELI